MLVLAFHVSVDKIYRNMKLKQNSELQNINNTENSKIDNENESMSHIRMLVETRQEYTDPYSLSDGGLMELEDIHK